MKKTKAIKELIKEIEKEMEVSMFEILRCEKDIKYYMQLDLGIVASAYSLSKSAEELKYHSAQYLAYNKILMLLEDTK